jgi:hypothetical protein
MSNHPKADITVFQCRPAFLFMTIAPYGEARVPAKYLCVIVPGHAQAVVVAAPGSRHQAELSPVKSAEQSQNVNAT